MRHILILVLLTTLATSIFAQLNTVEKAENNLITTCFPKSLIVVPSDKIDPFMITEPSEKIDSKMLIEILCPNQSLNNKIQADFSLPIAPNIIKKP